MKHPARSKTIIFNALCGALAVAEPNMALLKPVLGESAHSVMLFVVIVGNAVLRFYTTQPIVMKHKPAAESDS